MLNPKSIGDFMNILRESSIYIRKYVVIFIAVGIACFTTPQSFAHDVTFNENFKGITTEMQDDMAGCREQNYELCNIFASSVITLANSSNRPALAGIAFPYFKLACDNGVMWGCANLGLMCKLGTPGVCSDIEAARLYYHEACTGNGDESQGIPQACTWEKELTPKK